MQKGEIKSKWNNKQAKKKSKSNLLVEIDYNWSELCDTFKVDVFRNNEETKIAKKVPSDLDFVKNKVIIWLGSQIPNINSSWKIPC